MLRLPPWCVPVLLLLPATLAGQQAVLRGTVKDQLSNSGVPATALQLIDARGRRAGLALTDSLGSFTFSQLSPGAYRLRAEALGYARVETVTFQVAETTEVVVWMSAQALPLAPLEIVARPAPVHRHTGLAEFYLRMERNSGGAFITKEEIATRNPQRVTDLLNTVASFEANSGKEMLWSVRQPGCVPQIWLDGARLTSMDNRGNTAAHAAYEAVNFLLPHQVEGIEVYAGPATVPPAFGGTGGGCGVIVVWAKR